MSHLPIDKMSQPHFNTYYHASQRKLPLISPFQSHTNQPVPLVTPPTQIVNPQPIPITIPPKSVPIIIPPQTIPEQATVDATINATAQQLTKQESELIPPPSQFNVQKPQNRSFPPVRDFASKFPPTSLDDQFQTPFSLAQLNPKLPFETTCFLTPESQKCNYQLPPQPIPVQLGGDVNFGWDVRTSLYDDCCATLAESKQSSKSGDYQLSGYDPRPLRADQYANLLTEITHFPQGYNTPSAYIDDSSDLIYGELSSQREINQLFARPYKGFFSGAGTRSLGQKDLESALQQGLLTNLRQKPCQVTRGTSFYRYIPLADFGNPQRVEHIIMAPPELGGTIRGGDSTRDFVRRVDYDRRCKSRENGFYVNKVPKCGVPPARL
jgi:hypothetical protein